MKVSLFIFVLLFCTCLSAEDKPIVSAGSDVFLYDIKAVNVKVLDEVTGGCLPNPQGMETAVTAALVRNGFDILENLFFGYFVIHMTGYSITGSISCVVRIDTKYVDTISSIIPHAQNNNDDQHTLVELVTDVQDEILTGPKYTMQQRVQNSIAEAADVFLLMTVRAKKNLEKDFPQLLSTMEKNKQQQIDEYK